MSFGKIGVGPNEHPVIFSSNYFLLKPVKRQIYEKDSVFFRRRPVKKGQIRW